MNIGSHMPVIEVSGIHNETDFWLSRRALKALWTAEDTHFWHAARNAWIASLLVAYGAPPPRRVLEVGCGSGNVVRKLIEVGYEVTGVDTDRRLIEKAYERCKSATLVIGDIARLPPPLQGPYDVIGFFDVLEHLDKPEDLIRAALHWAQPGTLIIATVPALRSLHSVIDDLSGHKRRYEVGELARTFLDVGLSSVVEHGIFRTSLALIKQHRTRVPSGPRLEGLTSEEADQLMIETLRVPPAPINALMRFVCSIERRFCLRASRGKTGGSLVAVGRWGGAVKD
jgi:2-polyprenyl-3-methyl-5-hydroxy-6-metoxy-1,4-benzoquinol methylase